MAILKKNTNMIIKHKASCFQSFHLISIFILTPVLSYPKFQCPDSTEWKFIAGRTCNIPGGYHCLYDENNDTYTYFCDTRSYQSQSGHKLVLVGDLDRRDCEGTRYQPFTFSTNGMSSCIFEKTYCNEEGQVFHGDGTAKSDRQCRCDYTNSYDFITKPKNSCYCEPSEEDCSCYRKPCPLGFIMTPDYECIKTNLWTGKSACELKLSSGDKENKPTTAFIPSNTETDNEAYNPSNEYKTVITVLTVAVLSIQAFMMGVIFLTRSPRLSDNVNGQINIEDVMLENLELKNRLDNPITENIKGFYIL